nr:pyruvate kinase 1, cytosolic [Tanacetum cinerariifolium]
MHSNHLLLEEPIRMASILEPSKSNFFPAMTKIVGTLGPRSRSVDVISGCLKAGMSVARFDFSWGDSAYHQETLDNLRDAVKSTKKLCAVMLDTVGAEMQVVNKSEKAISLQQDGNVILTPDNGQEASSQVLPINFDGLAKAVKKGDTIFVGQYLFTGSETTSVWLEVDNVDGNDVDCKIKNSATLAGALFTLHASQIHIDLPTLTEKDKENISTWGVANKIDFLSLSYTRHAQDVREAREFLSKNGDLSQTQIFAKIENIEGLTHFDEILQEADGIILSRGNLGIDLPPEKVFLFQKAALYKCNMAGKPAVVTRVVDSMTDNLRPTRAEATDVANAVLDGSDAILLGAETLRGLYPVETISIVGKICAEAEKVFNQDLYFKKTVKYVGEPMSHLESIASSAVRAAIKVKASVIICFTSSGRAARLIAKYRPTMPVLSVVIPRLKTNQLKWSFSGAFEARQSLIVRGLFPMLADPRHPAESTSATNESVLKVALDHGKASGVIKSHDRVVVCQKILSGARSFNVAGHKSRDLRAINEFCYAGTKKVESVEADLEKYREEIKGNLAALGNKLDSKVDALRKRQELEDKQYEEVKNMLLSLTNKETSAVGPVGPFKKVQTELKFDDLGFPIPPTNTGTSAEGSNRINLVTDDGTMKDKNGARNTIRTGFGTGANHTEGRFFNHGYDHRMRKIKMPLFDGEDAHGWIYKHGMTSCDSIGTPIATKHLDADLSGTPIHQTKYHSMVGALMYLTASRPDIVHATCYCARYQAKPTEKHLTAVKRIFRYLKNTINMGLWYPKDNNFEPTTFLDSDHVGFLNSQVEYVSFSACHAQVLWLRTQLTDYGFHFDKILMYCDSKASIAISCNPVQHSHTKHIDVRYYFIKKQVEKGIVELFFVETAYQLADLFNKALHEDRFKYLVRRLASGRARLTCCVSTRRGDNLVTKFRDHLLYWFETCSTPADSVLGRIEADVNEEMAPNC